MQNIHQDSYKITVTQERFEGKDCWVARDEDGNWRSYCKASFYSDAREAAAGMFHADEIFAISGSGEIASAKVKTFIKSNGGVK